MATEFWELQSFEIVTTYFIFLGEKKRLWNVSNSADVAGCVTILILAYEILSNNNKHSWIV